MNKFPIEPVEFTTVRIEHRPLETRGEFQQDVAGVEIDGKPRWVVSLDDLQKLSHDLSLFIKQIGRHGDE